MRPSSTEKSSPNIPSSASFFSYFQVFLCISFFLLNASQLAAANDGVFDFQSITSGQDGSIPISYTIQFPTCTTREIKATCTPVPAPGVTNAITQYASDTSNFDSAITCDDVINGVTYNITLQAFFHDCLPHYARYFATADSTEGVPYALSTPGPDPEPYIQLQSLTTSQYQDGYTMLSFTHTWPQGPYNGYLAFFVYIGSVKTNFYTLTGNSINVTGLTNGVSYTLFLAYGNGISETLSSPVYVTPAARPSAPKELLVSSSPNQSIQFSFRAPSYNGGINIRYYTVYAYLNTMLIQSVNVTTTFGTISGLASKTQYTIAVKAYNAAGFSESVSASATSGEALFLGPINPDPPTILSITASNIDRIISINYQPPTYTGDSALTSCNAYLDGSERASCLVGSTCNITSVLYGQHSVKMLCKNANSYVSNFTSEYNVSLTDPNIPLVPTNISVPTYQSGKFSIYCSDISGYPGVKYQATCAPTISDYPTLMSAVTDVRPLICSGAVNGLQYRIQVASYWNGKYSDLSASIYAIPGTVPSAPFLQKVTAGTATGSVTLTFDRPSDINGFDITRYIVYINDVASTYTINDLTGSFNNTMTIALSSFGQYQLSVVAENTVGVSPQSNSLSFSYGEAPSAPTINSVSAGSVAGTVNIYFTRPVYNGGLPLTQYTVYINFQLSSHSVRDTDTTTYVVTATLSKYGSYQLSLVADNAVASSPQSSSVTYTYASVPTAPSLQNVTASSTQGSVILTFTASSDNSGSTITRYIVYQDSVATSFTLTPSTSGSVGTVATSSLTITVTGLSSASVYLYTIVAENSVGLSAASNVVSYTYGLLLYSNSNICIAARDNTYKTLTFPDIQAGTSAVLVHKSGILNCNINAFNGTNWGCNGNNGFGVWIRNSSNINVLPSVSDSRMTIVNTNWYQVSGSKLTDVKLTWNIKEKIQAGTYKIGFGEDFNDHTENDNSASLMCFDLTILGPVCTTGCVPSAPTIQSATNNQDGQTSITFTAPSSAGALAVTSYILLNDGLLTNITTTQAGVWKITGLTNGGIYTFSIVAVNDYGYSTASNNVTVTPGTVPSPPLLDSISGDKRAASTINLFFTTPINNGGLAINRYIVYKDGVVTTFTKTDSGLVSDSIAVTLTKAGTYLFTIVAENAAGVSAPSNNQTYIFATAPAAPTLESATRGSGQGSVILTFNPSSDNGGSSILRYIVYQNAEATAFTLDVSDTDGPYSRSITVTGLTVIGLYTYTVYAENSIGLSVASNDITFDYATVASAPTITTLTGDISTGRADITFTASTSNGGSTITSYILYMNGIGTAYTLPATASGGTFQVDGIMPNIEYHFTVRAVNTIGESLDSNDQVFFSDGRPSAPIIQSVTNYEDRKTLITFTAPTSSGAAAITSYILLNDGVQTSYTTAQAGTWQVTELTNGVRYVLSIIAVNSYGSSPSSDSLAATPGAVPQPPTNLQATQNQDRQTMISFTVPTDDGGHPITAYTVYKNNVNTGITAISSPINVTGLTGGVTYEFTVTATNIVGDSSASAIVTATPGSPPGVVRNVQAQNYLNSRTNITFSAPSYNGGHDILEYILYQDGQPTSFTSTSVTWWLVNNLSNGVSYRFNVVARNIFGLSDLSTDASATPAVPPSAPTDVSATSYQNRNSTVTLSSPQNGGALITLYVVLVTPGNFQFNSTTTTIVCTGLTNGVRYNFTAKAVNAAGSSDWSTVTSAFPAAAPSPPTLVSAVSYQDRRTEVSFNYSTSDGGFPIQTYIVVSNPENIEVTTTQSPVIVTGLTNGVSYSFTVVARNTMYDSSASLPSSRITPATSPGTPTNVFGLSYQNRSSTVSFDAPADNGGAAVTKYMVISSPGGFIANGTSSPIVVKGLTNGANYTFRVKAFNPAGSSPLSLYSDLVFPGSVANAPLNVSAVNYLNNRTVVTYNPPSYDGGWPVLSYVISVQSIPQVFNISGNLDLDYEITNLLNGYNYTIRVAAVNVVGISAWSRPAYAFPATLPSEPTGVTGSSYLNRHSLVRFNHPYNGGIPMLGYYVLVQPGNRLVFGTKSPINVTGLTNGQLYNFTMFSSNFLGNSSWSLVSNQTLPAAPPDTPINVFAAWYQNLKSQMTFDIASDNGAPVVNYTVLASATSNPTHTVTNWTSTLPLHISRLINGRNYSFIVRAQNPAGWSSWSTPVFAFPGAPTLPPIKIESYRMYGRSTGIQTYLDYPPYVNMSGFSPFLYQLEIRLPEPRIFNTTITSNGTTTIIVDDSRLLLFNNNSMTLTLVARTLNDAGYSANSVEITILPPDVPDKPFQHTAQNWKNRSIEVTAPGILPRNNGANITSYLFRLWPDDITISAPIKADLSPVAVNFTGLINGKVYNISYQAVNPIGGSVFANNVSAIPATYPDPPINVTAWSWRDRMTFIFFNPPANNGGAPIFNYTLTYFPTGNQTAAVRIPAFPSGRSVNGLINGVNYTVLIQAISNGGISFPSVPTYFVPAAIPSQMTNITAISYRNVSIPVSFLPPVSNNGAALLYYNVTIVAANMKTYYATLNVDTLSFDANQFGNIVNGFTHTIYVRAVNMAGVSPAYAIYALPALPPFPPRNIRAISYQSPNTSVLLEFPIYNGGAPIWAWQVTVNPIAVINNSSATNIQPINNTFRFAHATSITTGTITLSVPTLVNGVNYSMFVQAINGAGYSSASNITFAIPAAPPSVPQNITSVSYINRTIPIQYTNSSFENGAAIRFYTVTVTGSSSYSFNTTTNVFNLSNVDNGVTYTISIKAYNSAGYSLSKSTVAIPAAPPSIPVISSVSSYNDSSCPLMIAHPFNNGAAISQYIITSYPAGATQSFTAKSGTQNMYTFVNLTNGVYYNFSVVAINPAGVSIPSLISSLCLPSTKPSIPRNVTSFSYLSSYAPVFFELPITNGGSTISRYSVQVIFAKNNSLSFSVSCPGSPCNVTGLINGFSYYFRVAAINPSGVSPYNQSAAITPASIPAPPKNVSATNYRNSSTSITWQVASNNGDSVKDYLVTAYPGNISLQVGNVTSFIFPGLVNGVNYTFTVKARNNAGYSTASLTSNHIIPATMPDPPTNVTAISYLDRRASVSFNAPVFNGGTRIILYQIHSIPDNVTVTTTATSNIIVNGLTNGKNYTFVVRAINLPNYYSLSSLPSDVTIPAGIPGVPQAVTASSNMDSMTSVTIKPSNFTNGSPITRHIIMLRNGTFVLNVTTAETSLTIAGLINGVSYSVSVFSVSAGGISTSSMAVTFVPAAAPSIPRNLTATSLKNNFIPVTFLAPIYNGGVSISRYVLTVQTDVNTTYINTTNTSINVAAKNGQSTTISVQAVNSAGLVSASSESVVALPATTPDSPASTSVACLTSTQGFVHFNPPNDGGSSISLYEVLVVPTTTGSNITFNSTTSVIQIQTTGLCSAYSYYSRVRNDVGWSLYSTKAVLGSGTVPDPPAPVKGKSLQDSSTTITFSPPLWNGGYTIRNYTIMSMDQSIVIENAVSPVNIYNLVNGVYYSFYVKSANDRGYSDASTIVTVLPATIPSAPILYNKAEEVEAGAVTLYFNLSSSNGGTFIRNYTVYINNARSNFGGSNTSTSIRVTGLEYGVSYTFNIRSFNDAGGSLMSGYLTSVLLSVPHAPSSVSCTNYQDQRTTVTFSPPTNNGGLDILGYQIYVNRTLTTYNTTQSIITGLTNGQTYVIEVKAINSLGASPFSSPIFVTPLRPPSTIAQVRAIDNQDSKTTVIFAAPSSNGGFAIVNYTITSTDVDDNEDMIVTVDPNTNRSVDISNLKNSHTYTVVVVSNNGIYSSEPSQPIYARPATRPGSPTGVDASNGDGSGTVTVSFTLPDTNGANITSYILYVDGVINNVVSASSSSSSSSSSSRKQITMKNPVYGSSYSFIVAVDSSLGISSNSTAITFTAYKKPNAPVINSALSYQNSTSLISFSSSTDNGGSPVTGYTLVLGYTDNSNNVQSISYDVDASATIFSADGLTNGQIYVVEMYTKTNIFTSDVSTQSFTVLPAIAPVTAPTIDSASMNEDSQVSLNISDPTNNGGASINRYNITVQRLSSGNGVTYNPYLIVSTDNYLVIKSLVNGAKYSFSVIAINPAGASPASDPVVAVVGSIPSPPINVQVQSSQDGHVTLYVEAPEILGPGTTSLTSYIATAQPGNITQVDLFTDAYGHINITGLINGVNYSFTVVATNIYGSSEPSRPVYTIPVSAPLAPSRIRAINYLDQMTTIRVPAYTWVQVGGSPITSYSVQIESGDTVTFDVDSSALSPLSSSFGSLEVDLNVTGLTNGIQYTFYVMAHNQYGSSLASNVSATPSTVPSAPTSVTATSWQDKAIAISFDVPASDGGVAVTKYIATLEPGSITAESTSSPIQVTGLTNGQAYDITVVAVNPSGSSSPSDVVSATPATVPSAPTGVSVTLGKEYVPTIYIQFSAPAQNNGSPVKSYTVIVQAADGSEAVRKVTATSASDRVTVTDLTESLVYRVSVTATNDAGTSSPSTSVQAIPVCRPSAPTSAKAQTLGQNTLLVTFSAPTKTGGEKILNYTVTAFTTDSLTYVRQTNTTAAAFSNVAVSKIFKVEVYATTVVGDSVSAAATMGTCNPIVSIQGSSQYNISYTDTLKLISQTSQGCGLDNITSYRWSVASSTSNYTISSDASQMSELIISSYSLKPSYNYVFRVTVTTTFTRFGVSAPISADATVVVAPSTAPKITSIVLESLKFNATSLVVYFDQSTDLGIDRKIITSTTSKLIVSATKPSTDNCYRYFSNSTINLFRETGKTFYIYCSWLTDQQLSLSWSVSGSAPADGDYLPASFQLSQTSISIASDLIRTSDSLSSTITGDACSMTVSPPATIVTASAIVTATAKVGFCDSVNLTDASTGNANRRFSKYSWQYITSIGSSTFTSTQIQSLEDLLLTNSVARSSRIVIADNMLTAGRIYTFRLTVTNWLGSSSSADVNVTKSSSPIPSIMIDNKRIVDYLADTRIQPQVTASTCGSRSSSQSLTYQWRQVSGPSYTISSPSQLTLVLPALTLRPSETYVFVLKAWLSDESTTFSEASVIVQVADVIAPQYLSATFNSPLTSISLVFDDDTNMAGINVGVSFNCSRVLTTATVSSLGSTASPPTCVWLRPSNLAVTLGQSATINVGDAVAIRNNVLLSDDGYSVYINDASQPVKLPTTVPTVQSILLAPNIIGACDDLTLDGSMSNGNAGRSLKYTYSLINLDQVKALPGISMSNLQDIATLLASASSPSVTISSSLLPLNVDMTFILKVTNWIGTSHSTSITVKRQIRSIPTIVVTDGSIRTINPTDNLIISTRTQQSSCATNTTSVQLTWSTISQSPLLAGTSMYQIPSRLSSSSQLYLVKNSLRAGTTYEFQVILTVMGSISGLNSTARIKVIVNKSAIEASIFGGDRDITLSRDDNIILDATASKDPDFISSYPSTAFQLIKFATMPTYSWSCVLTAQRAPCFDSSVVMPSTAILTLPASAFEPSSDIGYDTYTFSVLITLANDTRTATASVTLTTTDLPVPSVFIRALSSYKLDSNSKLSLEAALMSSTGSSSISINTTLYSVEWSCSSNNLDLTDSKNVRTSIYRPNLVIAEQVLVPGSTYTFTVSVTNRLSFDADSGTASVTVVVNSAPTMGSCSIFPSEGIAMNTSFTLRCQGWTDDSIDMPLSYSFQLLSTDVTMPTIILVQPTSYPSSSLTLPQGTATANYTRTVRAGISDKWGATAYQDITVKVKPMQIATTQQATDMATDLIQNKLSDAIRVGDSSAVTQTVLSVVTLLSQGVTVTTTTNNTNSNTNTNTTNNTPTTPTTTTVTVNSTANTQIRDQLLAQVDTFVRTTYDSQESVTQKSQLVATICNNPDEMDASVRSKCSNLANTTIIAALTKAEIAVTPVLVTSTLTTLVTTTTSVVNRMVIVNNQTATATSNSTNNSNNNSTGSGTTTVVNTNTQLQDAKDELKQQSSSFNNIVQLLGKALASTQSPGEQAAEYTISTFMFSVVNTDIQTLQSIDEFPQISSQTNMSIVLPGSVTSQASLINATSVAMLFSSNLLNLYNWTISSSPLLNEYSASGTVSLSLFDSSTSSDYIIQGATHPIMITIPHTMPLPANYSSQCRWYNPATNYFSTDGCKVNKNLTTIYQTVCECTHLTDFDLSYFEPEFSTDMFFPNTIDVTWQDFINTNWRNIVKHPAPTLAVAIIIALYIALFIHAYFQDKAISDSQIFKRIVKRKSAIELAQIRTLQRFLELYKYKLKTDHLYLTLFYKSPNSLLSSKARVLLTMFIVMANLAISALLFSNTNNIVADISVGVQSSLIVFSMCVLIRYLFSRSSEDYARDERDNQIDQKIIATLRQHNVVVDEDGEIHAGGDVYGGDDFYIHLAPMSTQDNAGGTALATTKYSQVEVEMLSVMPPTKNLFSPTGDFASFVTNNNQTPTSKTTLYTQFQSDFSPSAVMKSIPKPLPPPPISLPTPSSSPALNATTAVATAATTTSLIPGGGTSLALVDPNAADNVNIPNPAGYMRTVNADGQAVLVDVVAGVVVHNLGPSKPSPIPITRKSGGSAGNSGTNTPALSVSKGIPVSRVPTSPRSIKRPSTAYGRSSVSKSQSAVEVSKLRNKGYISRAVTLESQPSAKIAASVISAINQDVELTIAGPEPKNQPNINNSNYVDDQDNDTHADSLANNSTNNNNSNNSNNSNNNNNNGTPNNNADKKDAQNNNADDDSDDEGDDVDIDDIQIEKNTPSTQPQLPSADSQSQIQSKTEEGKKPRFASIASIASLLQRNARRRRRRLPRWCLGFTYGLLLFFICVCIYFIILLGIKFDLTQDEEQLNADPNSSTSEGLVWSRSSRWLAAAGVALAQDVILNEPTKYLLMSGLELYLIQRYGIVKWKELWQLLLNSAFAGCFKQSF